MKRNKMLFIGFSCCLLLAFVGCSDCWEDGNKGGKGKKGSMLVVTDWSNLWPTVIKPENINVVLFNQESGEITEEILHPDGDVITPYGKDFNILLYGLGGNNENLRFREMEYFNNATAYVDTYFINGEEFVKQPGLLWGESYNDYIKSGSFDTFYSSPVAYTKLIHFEIVTVGDSIEYISSCEGKLSGVAGGINLSTKMNDGKNCHILFDAYKVENIYSRQLLHFGFSSRNRLTLTFSYEDGKTRYIDLDVTDSLQSLVHSAIHCKIVINFKAPEVPPEIDVIIEPWEAGLNGDIILR